MPLTSIYDYFKNKYIIKNINNFSSKYNMEKNENGYYIIPSELLDSVNDKICLYYDIYNNHIYKKRLSILRRRRYDLKKLNIKINEIESPPYPNNYNRLIKYRKRNKKENNLIQTNAILYLLKKGYKLVVNKDEINCTPEDSYKYFESYDAISIATDLSIKLNEDFKKTITYTGNYEMINQLHMRPSAPLYIDNTNLNTNLNNSLTTDNTNDINDIKSNSDILVNNNVNNFNNLRNSSFNEESIPEYHNNFKCSKPEHHEVNDKIYYFNGNTSNL